MMKGKITEILPNATIIRKDPRYANCIIRTYELRHYQLDDFTINLYGADLYIKEPGHVFFTELSGRMSPINYADEALELSMEQGKIIFLHPNFVDYYVKIIQQS